MYVHTCMYACVHTHTCTYIHTCTHTNTHAHAHAVHAHTKCTQSRVPYSGKVWWGKSLVKLPNLAKLQVIRQLKPTKPVRRPVNHRHSPNFSLLDAQFAKLFPHQTFLLYSIWLLQDAE